MNLSKTERAWLIFDRVIAGIIVTFLYILMQRGCLPAQTPQVLPSVNFCWDGQVWARCSQ